MLGGLVNQYRVLTTIGAGGMGVVYKAIDTRLNRPVAIKAIRDSGGMASEAVIRLRAEALAAASLDHPYICKIYELLDTESGTLIVMEYVEGETLATVLQRAVPRLVDALRYGSEIAEGLSDAHGHGLIHRDIKPSNVMITTHGHVKLLDFGVARVNTPGSGTTTTHTPLTRPGSVLGTPLYMAPEQALGHTVTARADLFSLGIVLFECLTGQLPFAGGTRDAYVHAMLSGQKRRIQELAPSVPDSVRRIVEACLEGEPARRPETAALVASELRRAADEISSRGSLGARDRSWWRATLPAVASIVAVCAVVAAYLLWRASRGADVPALSIVPAVTSPSTESDAHISPDRRWLSFLSDRDGPKRLYVQAMEAGDARAIDVPGDSVASHAWSPDGKEFACVVRQQGGWFLEIVPAFFGGLPRAAMRLVPVENARVVRWIPSGIYVEVVQGGAGESLWRLDANASRIEDVTAHWPPNEAGSRTDMDVSPSGLEVVYKSVAGLKTDLWTARLDGSGLRRLTDDAFVKRSPMWVGDTSIIAFESNRGGQLDIWNVDATSGRLSQVTSSETAERPTDATSDGSIMVFEQTAEKATLWLLAPDSPDARQLSNEALSDLFPSASADGGRIAFQRRRPALVEGYDLLDSRVLVAALSGHERLSTPTPVADGFAPRISPDGAWIAYLQRTADPRNNVLAARNVQTGETRSISSTAPLSIRSTRLPADWAAQKVAWGRDGFLYFIEAASGRQQIARANPSSSSPPETVVPASPRVLQDLRLSTDGTRLAYLSWQSDLAEIHVRDLRTGADAVAWKEPARQIDVFLRGWIRDGSVLFLRRHDPVSSGAGTQQVEVVAVGADTARTVSMLDGAFLETARLDPPGSFLYVTRAENGLHNLYAVSTVNGSARPVTRNTQEGVSFSGIEPLGDGAVIYVRAESRQDIWLARKKTR